MSLDFGSGVSRTLDAAKRQFSGMVFQASKPPLDSEVNLISQVAFEASRQNQKVVLPSGFFLDPTRARNDFRFNANWTNRFGLGNPKVPTGEGEGSELEPTVWASVNGWVIPVAGTDVNCSECQTNVVRLYPAPATDSRIDFVFLEVWACRVDSNPSTVNKPSASTVYKYGNVLYGGTNITDDLEDPTLGFRTTGRIQIQYRLRVHGQGTGMGASVALDVYPEGLGDPNVRGQGTATLPISGFGFTNMRETLGDPGLWRAGDGDPDNALGTVDGYVYAIPVCGVFRRNTSAYVAVNSGPNPNHNGAFCRTPAIALMSNPLAGARILTAPTLNANLSYSAGVSSPVTIAVSNLANSALADTSLVLSSTFLILEDEIVAVSAVNVGGGTITIPAGGRGRYGTARTAHATGTTINFFNTRPDGLFADQIAEKDVLDLRHGVNPGDWDFGRLLEHNVGALLKGNLRSTWKHGANSDTQGPVTHEITFLDGNGASAVPNQTEEADGPDGIRTVWSDAATPQTDITILLDNTAPKDTNLEVGITNPTFDAGVNYAWDVTPGFFPSGFLNVQGLSDDEVFANGSVLLLFTGGADGTGGARATFRDGSTRAVRSLMPKEWWKAPTTDSNQVPWTLRFLHERAFETAPPAMDDAEWAARHVGPMYPWWKTNFERPFIVLGGLLNSALRVSVPVTRLGSNGSLFQINLTDAGFNFDTAGQFFSKDDDGNFENDPTGVSVPLLRGEKTLWGMLTDNGRDLTGDSSEIYVVLYGDKDSCWNNGAFKVVGAGTSSSGYTDCRAANATSIVLKACSPEAQAFVNSTGNTVTVEFRSQESNSEDTSSWNTKVADIAIVLTDIGGLASDHPWSRAALGYEEDYDLTLAAETVGGVSRAYADSKALIAMTLQYHPGRSGMVRVPDEVHRFALFNSPDVTQGSYLRQSKGLLDEDFNAIGTPETEVFWDPAQVQTWNRLPAKGLHAPEAPSYGGEVVGYTEQDREHELFFDRGSKTLVFRPFRDRAMTLRTLSFTESGVFDASGCLLGSYDYENGNPKDGLQMFTGTSSTGKKMAVAVPREYMPRFGRQDIPFYQDDTGERTFLSGINHLFRDDTNNESLVFNVIGGRPTTANNPAVNSMFFITGEQGESPYAGWPTADYADLGTGPANVNNLPFLWARKTTEINSAVDFAPEIIAKLEAVHSSDLGHGLKGIQLPPYYGPARIYGVYDIRDFDAKGGDTFKTNRYEMESDPAPNLLREDADQQTLFILQDGAKDLTGEDGDHTYILPFNAIDITRALNYTSGDVPEDYQFVVECSVFGFAKGFISENNFVLVRKFNGRGLSYAGSSSGNIDGTDFELGGVHMVIPCAAAYHDQVYVAYDRTVYQGDPFMSRNATKTDADYENRYGQLSVGAQYQMRIPIQQFDSDGDFIPETPNARSFEVLASLDFWTTMGTGKIGGALQPGTVLDIGHISSTFEAAHREPEELSSKPWRVVSRTFSEGQKENQQRASLGIQIQNSVTNTVVDLNPVNGTVLTTPIVGSYTALKVTAPGGITEVLWFAKSGTNTTTLTGEGISTDNIVTWDNTSIPISAGNLYEKVNAHPVLSKILRALPPGVSGSTVLLEAVDPGAAGNLIKVEVKMVSPTPLTYPIQERIKLLVPSPNSKPQGAFVSAAFLSGGEDMRVNAGTGASQVNLVGMTERLPLGALLQDSDFLCENPLCDNASAVKTSTAGPRPVQSILPLTNEGGEYDRFLGEAGSLVAMSEGTTCVTDFTAYRDDVPSGTKRFRLYRGGGPIFVLDGQSPGGPVDWAADSIPAPLKPVLKGGLLACRALLVRNFREEVLPTPYKVSDGDEIQMIVITRGILGDTHTQECGLNLGGIVSPAGYGEGWVSADRYRLEGKPLMRAYSRAVPDPSTVSIAPYPDEIRTAEVGQ